MEGGDGLPVEDGKLSEKADRTLRKVIVVFVAIAVVLFGILIVLLSI